MSTASIMYACLFCYTVKYDVQLVFETPEYSRKRYEISHCLENGHRNNICGNNHIYIVRVCVCCSAKCVVFVNFCWCINACCWTGIDIEAPVLTFELWPL